MVATARHRNRAADGPRVVAEGGFLTGGAAGGSSDPRTPPLRVITAAGNLRIDLCTVEVVALLRDAGIGSILLKGPSFARWLYEDPNDRPYTDTDLLVSPGDLAAARHVLAQSGFIAPFSGRAHELVHHAEPWVRSADGAEVDLHHRLPDVSDPERAWSSLARHTETMLLRGHPVTILDEAARTLHVVLHAAQHGTGRSSSVVDLEHALERVSAATWNAAAALGAEMGAEDAFTAGLALLGADARAMLPVAAAADADSGWALAQILRDEQPGEALVQGLARLKGARGIKAKAALVSYKVFPPRAVLAMWSPLARRGPLGVAAARVWRPVWLLVRAPGALVRYRRARVLQKRRSGRT